MTQRDLIRKLAARAVSGRYDFFVRVGALLTAIGAALFVVALSSGDGTRAWQAFHVDWLYFTGLAAGSHAFAVQATDAAGNVDPTPATFSWTIETPVPVPPDPGAVAPAVDRSVATDLHAASAFLVSPSKNVTTPSINTCTE